MAYVLYNRMQTWSGSNTSRIYMKEMDGAMDGGEKCSEMRTAFWFGNKIENKFFTVHVWGGSACVCVCVCKPMSRRKCRNGHEHETLISIFATNLFSLNTKSQMKVDSTNAWRLATFYSRMLRMFHFTRVAKQRDPRLTAHIEHVVRV